MEAIKPINSLVAIRIPYLVRDKIEYGSLILDYVATTKIEEQHNAITHGVVEALPATLYDIHNHGVNTELNIEVGDTVYFDKMYSSMHTKMNAATDAPAYNFLTEDEKGMVLLIPYRAIILRDRKGELESCNDFVVGEIIPIPKHEFEVGEKFYKDRILVAAKHPNTSYKSGLPAPRVEVGQVAICRDQTVMPIQDRFHEKQLFRIRRRQIVGVE